MQQLQQVRLQAFERCYCRCGKVTLAAVQRHLAAQYGLALSAASVAALQLPQVTRCAVATALPPHTADRCIGT